MLPLPPHRLYRPAMVVVAIAAALAAPAAQAIEPFVLQDIRVEGLQRTDPGTVFAALPFRVGDSYSDDKAAAWAEQNRTYAALWPNITRKGEAPADAEQFKDETGIAVKYDIFDSAEALDSKLRHKLVVQVLTTVITSQTRLWG